MSYECKCANVSKLHVLIEGTIVFILRLLILACVLRPLLSHISRKKNDVL